MSRTRLVCGVLAVAVIAALAVTPISAASHIRRCGDLVARQDHYRQLRAYDTTCARARSVVRAWASKADNDGGWVAFRRPAHWRCRLFTVTSGQLIRCEQRGSTRRVTFRPGYGP